MQQTPSSTTNTTSAAGTADSLDLINSLPINDRRAEILRSVDTNQVTIAGGDLTVTDTLTLTAGRLNTSPSNKIIIQNTIEGAVQGGSGTTYVNGPMQRVLPSSLLTGTTYRFPVGKDTAYLGFELVLVIIPLA